MIQLYLFDMFECNANLLKNEYPCGTMRFGKYDFPRIKAYRGEIPKDFITYSEATRTKDYSCGLASFDDDKILERVWNNLDKYIPIFSKFKCVGEPDFSLKIGQPRALQIANTYCNHIIACKMQEAAINVLPSPSWSSTESYEFCFDGYEKGGAVLISTIGTLRDERSRMYFKSGFEEMLKRLSPDAVVLYGDVNETLLKWLPKQLHIEYVEHKRFIRARKHGSKRSF